MRADALPRARPARPSSALQAGNVNTGAFDPLAEICARARAAGRLGACGRRVRPVGRRRAGARRTWCAGVGRRRLLGDRRAQVAERALRQRPRLRARRRARCARRWRSSAAYLPSWRDSASPTTTRPNCRAGRAGVEVWAALRSLGRAGLADADRAHLPPRARFAEGLRAAGYEVLNDVVLNQVLVSFGDAETTRRVIAAHPGRRHLLVRRHRLAGRRRRCASASPPGPRPTPTSSAAWPRCCASRPRKRANRPPDAGSTGRFETGPYNRRCGRGPDRFAIGPAPTAVTRTGA